MESALLKRIVVDPKIMAGKPIIKGTRVPVDAIIHKLPKVKKLRTYSRTIRGLQDKTSKLH
jgi:hypothetical protein